MSYSVLLSVALPFPKCYAKRGGNHANANRKIACVAGLRRQRGGNNGLYIVINRIIYLPVAANSAYAVDEIMLVFAKLICAAIELALVPMSVFIILPLILCTMHSESADIALAISQIMVLMLHPMAYCAFALMECAFGYPFAPSMLSFVISPSSAFYRACMPMPALIARPVGIPLMLMRLLISASTYAIDEVMLSFVKLHRALIE